MQGYLLGDRGIMQVDPKGELLISGQSGDFDLINGLLKIAAIGRETLNDVDF